AARRRCAWACTCGAGVWQRGDASQGRMTRYMASQLSLPGISYPSRAERLDNERFSDYKVFVDFWNPLTEKLIENFRALQVRDDASIMGIHGPQGAGKTMFTRQLRSDYEDTKSQLKAGIAVNPENLWQRISSGGSLDQHLI